MYTLNVVESYLTFVIDFLTFVDLEGRVYHLDLDRAMRQIEEYILKKVEIIKVYMFNAMSYVEKNGLSLSN